MKKHYIVLCTRISYRASGGKNKRAYQGSTIKDKGRGVDFGWLVEAGLLEEVDAPVRAKKVNDNG